MGGRGGWEGGGGGGGGGLGDLRYGNSLEEVNEEVGEHNIILHVQCRR